MEKSEFNLKFWMKAGVVSFLNDYASHCIEEGARTGDPFIVQTGLLAGKQLAKFRERFVTDADKEYLEKLKSDVTYDSWFSKRDLEQIDAVMCLQLPDKKVRMDDVLDGSLRDLFGESYQDVVEQQQKVHESRDAFVDKQLKLISAMRSSSEESMRSLRVTQEQRDKRFFGLGYYWDRTVGRSGFMERNFVYHKCLEDVQNLNLLEKDVRRFSVDQKILSESLSARKTGQEPLRKVMEQEQGETLEVVFENTKDDSRRKSNGLSLG